MEKINSLTPQPLQRIQAIQTDSRQPITTDILMRLKSIDTECDMNGVLIGVIDRLVFYAMNINIEKASYQFYYINNILYSHDLKEVSKDMFSLTLESIVKYFRGDTARNASVDDVLTYMLSSQSVDLQNCIKNITIKDFIKNNNLKIEHSPCILPAICEEIINNEYYSNNNLPNNKSLQYRGGWKNNQRNGVGKSYYQDGKLEYDGQWKDGKKHGEGDSYNTNRTVQYSGSFENDLFHGNGKWNQAYVICFGSFKAGKRNGICTVVNRERREADIKQLWEDGICKNTNLRLNHQ